MTYSHLNPIKPGGGALRAPPYAFLLTAPKRMLRSTRNFLTFPKYQKQKKSKNLSFIFLTLPPTTDTRVIPDNGVTRTNKFGKKK